MGNINMYISFDFHMKWTYNKKVITHKPPHQEPKDKKYDI